MSLSEYETTVVIKADQSGDQIEATLERVRETVGKQGGKVTSINHWGRKKLAYPMNKQTRGVFVHTKYLGPNSLVSELERNLRITDNVLRFMTIKLADKVSVEDRTVEEYVKPDYSAVNREVEEVVAAPVAEETDAENADADKASDNASDEASTDAAGEAK